MARGEAKTSNASVGGVGFRDDAFGAGISHINAHFALRIGNGWFIARFVDFAESVEIDGLIASQAEGHKAFISYLKAIAVTGRRRADRESVSAGAAVVKNGCPAGRYCAGDAP